MSVDDARRLDRLLAGDVCTILPAAIERAGISAREEICLRTVRNAARVRLADPDGRVAVAWTVSLADAIARTLADGGPDVVRYPSRTDACIDMLEGAATGDLRRAWAWHQLGLWPTAERAEHAETIAIATLCHEAELAVPLLAAVARRGALGPLVRNASPDAWYALARAVLRAHTAPMNLATPDVESVETREPAPGIDSIDAAPTSAIVSTLATSSDILRAAGTELSEPYDLVLTRAVAILGLLELEPAAARKSRTRVFAGQLATWLTRQAAHARHAPAHVATERSLTGRQGRHAAPARHQSAAPPANGSTAGDRSHPSPYVDLQPEREIPTVRRSGWTHVGGLVLLLNVVVEAGLIEATDPDGPLSRPPVRWVMHRLALSIATRLGVPVSGHDPAVLAFAGLAPDSDSPSIDDGALAATDEERAALDALHARVVAVLRQRCGVVDEEADVLLNHVCSREAEISVDPGWIEARFNLADARTDIRRAGLDLDPGWLPWLGVVVRFLYA